jgi:hypothetical protein
MSAASALFKSAFSVRPERGTAVVPVVAGSAAGASFVVESEPIPVRQAIVGSISLVPKKLATISTFSGEMARHSDIEKIVRDVITTNVGAALDSAVFGAAAATTAAPAGIRNGIAALTATTGGTVDAMRKDAGQLVAAIAAIANGQIVLVGSPDAVVKLQLNANPALPYPVFSSGGLAAGTLMAVATNALAVAVNPVPSIEASTEALIHYEDASPAQIGTVGSPATIAAPARSLYQTDTIGLKCTLSLAWGLRTTGAVAWVTGITW